jgi:hypothetical protein
MSIRRSGNTRRRVAALALAAAGAGGALTAVTAVPASAAPAATRCAFAQTDLTFTSSAPARVIAQGECAGDGSLFVKITRNGTVVFSGGNGVGIVTAIHNCQGGAVSDYIATWSTGQTDEGTFPCG